MKTNNIKNLLTDNFYVDSLLYHYTTLDSACKIINSNSLRLSSLSKTNDPLEFLNPKLFVFDSEIDRRDKIYKDLKLSLEERKRFVRFFCFSIDSDFNKNEDRHCQTFHNNYFLKGWARNRMWVQYAENHKGVCLVFDKENFIKQFNLQKTDGVEILKPQKINYTNNFEDLENDMTNITSEIIGKTNFRNFFLDNDRKKYIFQKCEDYRDENEYRFALIDRNIKNKDDEKYVDFGTSLKAVILGQNFSQKKKLELPQNVSQFQINWECGYPIIWC